MDIRIKTWLNDIHQSIDEIFEFVGAQRDFNIYKNDLKTKKAVERNIEIIGEVVNRILKAETNFPLKNAKRIINTRNRIIHSYDHISDEVIWLIISKELPVLKDEVLDLISEEEKKGASEF